MQNYQISFYVPLNAAATVKRALFNIGVGRQGDYDHACWQTFGQGQFRPLDEANPTIGDVGTLTLVSEVKVEMLCHASLIDQAILTLKEAHPYEEPAYTVIQLYAP